MPDPVAGKSIRIASNDPDKECPTPSVSTSPTLELRLPPEQMAERTVEMQKGKTWLHAEESPAEQTHSHGKSLETAGSLLCIAALVGGIWAGSARNTNLLLLAAGGLGLGLIVFVIGRFSGNRRSKRH